MITKTKYLQLNDLNAYKTAFNLSNYVCEIVVSWGYFERDTVGKQFVRSVDSVSANIAEGFGRHYKKDKIKFYNYSVASVLEALDWNEKSKRRGYISEDQYEYILKDLKKLPREINHLSDFTNRKLKL